MPRPIGVKQWKGLRMEPSGITRELTLDLIDASGASTTVQAELSYNATDPLAVTALFRTKGSSVRWVFARDLLTEGVFAPAGDGDVHIWPCLDASGRAVVIIELSSP
ncbi:MAG: SsgA family sporulation/cell division regulator, partial [Propionibacteriales bacterium]|nr:SsgA family sporulation/cell division regulator [Propionibacteriales bacterium]